jgi:transposase
MKTTTVGIDLAKNLFQVRAVDERGKGVLRKQLRRDRSQQARERLQMPERRPRSSKPELLS